MKRVLTALSLIALTLGGCPISQSPTGNAAPTAKLNVSPTSGSAPLTVALDGRASSDPDGTLVAYNWSFGDGSAPVNAPTGNYTYTTPGTYRVTLTVVDDAGEESTEQFDLLVN